MATITLSSLPVADSWSMHGGSGWPWMVPMMLGMALFWGALILGFVWLVRGVDRRPAADPEEPALRLLDRRLAEGSVSLDDYHQRRDVLTGATALPRDTSIG